MVETTATKILYQVGESRVFPFPIRFISRDDVHCYISVNGSERKLADSEYTIENKEDYSDGANVTLNIDPIPAGATLAIVRECDIIQTVSFPINGKFPSSSNEEALDRLTMICQELNEKFGRTPSTPVTGGLINASDILELITIASQNSDEAKRLVQQFLSQFSGLVTSSDGKLYWKNCELLTACNHDEVLGPGGDNGGDGGNGDDDDGGDDNEGGNGSGGDGGGGNGGNGGDDDGGDDDDVKTSIPGEQLTVEDIPDAEPKGKVAAYIYRREINLRMFHFSSFQKSDSCQFEYYLTGVNFNWDKALSFVKDYGKLVTREGYQETWEDENGEVVTDCISDDSYAPYCNGNGEIAAINPADGKEYVVGYNHEEALAAMNKDIAAFIKGDLHYNGEPPFSEYAYPETGWQGYKWYRRQSHRGQDLTAAGQDFSVETSNGAGWYSAWGGVPCGQSPEGTSFTLHVDTVAFEWKPDNPQEEAPTKVVLTGEDGVKRKYDFGTEYCLTGRKYIHADWFKAVSCSDGCAFPVLRCIVEKLPGMENENVTDGQYYKPDKVYQPYFTYEGVLFGGITVGGEE